MTNTLEKLSEERHRKRQVRRAFERGLGLSWAVPSEARAFFLACADYLIFGRRRLIEQDTLLVRCLQSRVSTDQTEDHEAIEELKEHLQTALVSANALSDASVEFQRQGDAGRRDFEKVAEGFLGIVVDVLAKQGHSLSHLTSTLLSEEDWADIARINEHVLSDERYLFETIQAVAPEDLDPEIFPSERSAA